MTEYEAAALAYRYAALWVGLGVAFVIGLGQIVTVAVGTAIMCVANHRWDRELNEQRQDREQRAKREDQRHAETIEALQALMQDMEQQGEGRRVLVEGTAGRA